jgi:hypothetical protein
MDKKDRDKFIVNWFGECPHQEWDDGLDIPNSLDTVDDIAPFCKVCGYTDIPYYVNNLSTWSGFGWLWDKMKEKELLFDFMKWGSYRKTFSQKEEIINPYLFADAVYLFLKEYKYNSEGINKGGLFGFIAPPNNIKNLIDNSESLDPDIAKIVSKNFSTLLREQEKEYKVMSFILSKGLYLQRMENGTIKLIKNTNSTISAPFEWSISISSKEWETIITSMGKEGETNYNLCNLLTEFLLYAANIAKKGREEGNAV